MSTNYEAGSIVTGKVVAIKPFGAFVALDDEKQGLVHISEIKHGFVKDINDVLTVGEEVNVKILSIDEESGKISLSIKATEEAPKSQPKKPRRQGAVKATTEESTEGFNTLREKLQEWIEKSERKDLIKK
ncbi:S1 domain-containing post-transcriptional regulator GSP13 [Heyndrickxia ginsengihumi]|uniref:General stress protein n=1 Tax=Heyndrickxia ginsengihumi TaxID=363870 RepID=A0A0A6V9W6_9BACI|nr:S1 domain-containing post-transcriptional regulator GSP13 [Heyndrickxia ginsengihumi]KHD84361.1 general stress protein [Heyndrickxia ginsengihumi]MBE6184654.1 general stress protein 13 [Bacillus sp. (in: firmicutes)]MCM3023255.1 S1 domain-containing post-transcriptional regulator GSP13 [Heyndrickxia ginsengihumi]NEY20833.1 general stress protein 13 [Heyndrickxia ginsengihumi]